MLLLVSDADNLTCVHGFLCKTCSVAISLIGRGLEKLYLRSPTVKPLSGLRSAIRLSYLCSMASKERRGSLQKTSTCVSGLCKCFNYLMQRRCHGNLNVSSLPTVPAYCAFYDGVVPVNINSACGFERESGYGGIKRDMGQNETNGTVLQWV